MAPVVEKSLHKQFAQQKPQQQQQQQQQQIQKKEPTSVYGKENGHREIGHDEVIEEKSRVQDMELYKANVLDEKTAAQQQQRLLNLHNHAQQGQQQIDDAFYHEITNSNGNTTSALTQNLIGMLRNSQLSLKQTFENTSPTPHISKANEATEKNKQIQASSNKSNKVNSNSTNNAKNNISNSNTIYKTILHLGRQSTRQIISEAPKPVVNNIPINYRRRRSSTHVTDTNNKLNDEVNNSTTTSNSSSFPLKNQNSTPSTTENFPNSIQKTQNSIPQQISSSETGENEENIKQNGVKNIPTAQTSSKPLADKTNLKHEPNGYVKEIISDTTKFNGIVVLPDQKVTNSGMDISSDKSSERPVIATNIEDLKNIVEDFDDDPCLTISNIELIDVSSESDSDDEYKGQPFYLLQDYAPKTEQLPKTIISDIKTEDSTQQTVITAKNEASEEDTTEKPLGKDIGENTKTNVTENSQKTFIRKALPDDATELTRKTDIDGIPKANTIESPPEKRETTKSSPKIAISEDTNEQSVCEVSNEVSRKNATEEPSKTIICEVLKENITKQTETIIMLENSENNTNEKPPEKLISQDSAEDFNEPPQKIAVVQDSITDATEHLASETLSSENVTKSTVEAQTSTETTFNYHTPKTIISPSLFPNVPPYINFSSHAVYGPPLPPMLHKVLRWKNSPTIPKVVKRVVLNSGFRIMRNTLDWIAVWDRQMKSPCFQTMRSQQKFNHVPGSKFMHRKDTLWMCLNECIKKFGQKEFGFMQKTYVLPEDLPALRQDWPKHTAKLTKWIVKPPNSSRGNGICLVNSWKQFPKDEPLIVQKYIERPLLINENKFDMRLYVIVTSVNPLRLYMHTDGLARFASVKYSAELDTLDDRYMHLTNYSVNKLSRTYSKNEDVLACQGHKWTVQSLWSCLEARGIDTKRLWATLRNLVIKTFMSCEAGLNTAYRQNVNFRYNVYELFGFDILLDENLIPWLLEVNISPSLHSELPLDWHVKGPLVQAIFNTALFQVPPKLSETKEQKLLEELKLKGPLCYDKRLYATCLTSEEIKKHNRFTNDDDIEIREEYLDAILDDLLPDDVRCIVIAEDELARCKPLERIFPTADTHHYLKFLERPRYYNRLLDAWETRYEKNREEGYERIRELCATGYHLQVSQAALDQEPQVEVTDIDLLHVKTEEGQWSPDADDFYYGHPSETFGAGTGATPSVIFDTQAQI